jgi:hypothetical protein
MHATIERAFHTTDRSSESQSILWAVDSAYADDDDAVLDSWLASLPAGDFDYILSFLAGGRADVLSALDPTG